MGSLPPGLLAEVRHAFQACSRHHAASQRTRFSSLSPLLKSSKPTKRTKKLPIQVVHHKEQAQKQEDSLYSAAAASDSTELVPRPEGDTSLETGHKVQVPLKVIPKAQITPALRLSPKERLHIEQLTRAPPPPTTPPVYRRRLRIYSAGNGRIYFMTFSRFAAIAGLSLVTFIIAPAHVAAGTPLLLVAGIWLAGFVPLAYVNWTLRPWVTEVFLELPTFAQGSPKAAMEYAKKLPSDAMLDIRFMRSSTITDVVTLKLAQTRPARSPFRPVSFEWIDSFVQAGRFLRPTPTQFYVKPESAGGKAARDTIPGIWSKVYQRLTGVESGAVARWQR